ncbi:sulfotransferase [Hanstruepera marina]|uniref:sulfotransferase n=1 Tax=Hanstruepera marina TaxID=2873265 RepID=UPI001CA768F5|nr:sulfotransferase [Hanstruepera marina]
MILNFKKKGGEKIFCIGLNKTGTTSLGSFFEMNNYPVANQRAGGLLLKAYLKRDFNEIIRFCSSKDRVVFQDVPFSLPYTYQHLFTKFPDSKFILTIRNSPEEWYESILNFHSNFYNNGKIPTKESLKNSNYIYKGWSWELMNGIFFNNNDMLYDKESLIKFYNNHIETVLDYFKNNKAKLLVINIANKSDFYRLCEFFKIKTQDIGFPKITSDDIVNRNYSCDFLK